MPRTLDQYKILIVDSDSAFIFNLSFSLKCAGFNVLGEITEYVDFIKKINIIKPDLIILGNLFNSSVTEVDVAKYVYSKTAIPFVFITTKDKVEIIDQIVRFNPFGLYFKPINYIELIANLQLALARIKPLNENLPFHVDKNFLFIKSSGRLIKIQYNEILFFKSEHVYVNIRLVNGRSYLVRSTLIAYLESLPKIFIQTHRSYIVNLSLVNEFSSCSLKVSEYKIPISKMYRNKVFDILENLHLNLHK